MTLSVAGLDNCKMNFLDPIGTNYTINFVVWSATQPPISAMVNRTVRGLDGKGARSFCR
jgi:hypothetical protein